MYKSNLALIFIMFEARVKRIKVVTTKVSCHPSDLKDASSAYLLSSSI